MNRQETKLSIRWLYLAVGAAALLFAGIIYGWSILKAPLAEEFGWSAGQLALNFTLTMCFFCLGGMAGGVLVKKAGAQIALVLAGALSCLGFLLTARLDGSSVAMLYVSYGLLAGTGIGIAYNVIISTVSAWFPDKKGVCSGVLMMGFGASALVIGSAMGALMGHPAVGWRAAFSGLGAALGIVLAGAGLIVRPPAPGQALPKAEARGGGGGEPFEARDYPPGEMIRRFTFWRAFVCIVFLAAVGNTVISFARDLSISVGAGAGLATTLVGVLSVCNGLGRIATGAVFDRLGRRPTMLLANVLAIAAAGVTLLSVLAGSVPLCVAGLCATGFSYGACPTISSAFVAEFYGSKYFSSNFPIMNFNLMGASLLATASSMLLTAGGSYVAPFTLLLVLAALALLLNLSVKRP